MKVYQFLDGLAFGHLHFIVKVYQFLDGLAFGHLHFIVKVYQFLDGLAFGHLHFIVKVYQFLDGLAFGHLHFIVKVYQFLDGLAFGHLHFIVKVYQFLAEIWELLFWTGILKTLAKTLGITYIDRLVPQLYSQSSYNCMNISINHLYKCIGRIAFICFNILLKGRISLFGIVKTWCDCYFE